MITIVFVIGYFAFYLYRVGLSVVHPMWLSELELAGSSKPDALRMVGNIVSLGMLAPAIIVVWTRRFMFDGGCWVDDR